jgi:subtilase family serine protease
LLLALLVAAAAVAVLAGSGSTHRAAVARGVTPDVMRAPNVHRHITRLASPTGTVAFNCQLTAPTDPVHCYGPDQMRAAYGTQALLDKGYTGAGRTIVIIDAYGSPTLSTDVPSFDGIWGLPATNLTTHTPFGIDPTTPDNAEGWAGETTLDVEWSHAIAPGAKIALVIAKSNDDSDILDATQYAIDHNLGDTISQSFGEAEQCMTSAVSARQHKLFRQAIAKGITLFASSGDNGAGQPACSGPGLIKAASTPASDPNVTGVGGTFLDADGVTGAYISETTWNEDVGGGQIIAGGGGQSILFHRPLFQLLASHDRSRDVPDVSYNAAVFHGVIVAFEGTFFLFGGTSAGSPQWAGIQAIVDQIAGHRMGNINPALYALALLPGKAKPFHDIADGSNNSVPDQLGGTITGFTAVKGYDMATGLGTPNIGALAPLIAKLPPTTTPTD